MNDRELLELAAKAAGGQVQWEDCVPWFIGGVPGVECEWNPLEDDGDAMRLAIKLGVCFGPNFDGDKAVCFGEDGNNITEQFGNDPYAATRRAIVRAAAEIGRQMQEGGAA